MLTLPKQEDYEQGNVAWRETRDPNPLDRQLRTAGATLHSRPKVGKPRWMLNGVVYSQEELEKMLDL